MRKQQIQADTESATKMQLTPTTDRLMRNAFKACGVPLWVPPSEVDSYLSAMRWSQQICIELREWFARVWSMAFAAGYRGVPMVKVDRSASHQMLVKMGYADGQANELADMLVEGLPGLYRKGLSLSGYHLN